RVAVARLRPGHQLLAAASAGHCRHLPRIPTPAEGVTARLDAEADAALAREALHVHDPAERDGVPPVLDVEGERAVLPGREGLLEPVGGGGLDDRAHDLPALEADLDTDALSHGRRAP